MCDTNHEEYDREGTDTNATVKAIDEYLRIHSMSKRERIKYEILSLFKPILKLVGYFAAIIAIFLVGSIIYGIFFDSEDQGGYSNDGDYPIMDEPIEELDAVSGATEETEPDYSDYNISGTVKNVYIANDGPTFIDLNYQYPDERRISVIIWPENLDKFQTFLDNLMPDEKIHIKGELGTYKGVKQVELSNIEQVTRDGY